jgi:hypothetical protein
MSIQITDVVQPIRIALTGERALLMHSARTVDPLDPVTRELGRLTSKRMKTLADHEQIARVEWHGGLWLNQGRPCIPPEAIEAAFVEGAKTRNKGKAAQAGFICKGPALLEYDGPQDVDTLWTDERFRFRCPVRIGNARTIRTRPMFRAWRAEIEAEFLGSLLSREMVVEFFQVSGACKGIGDWRPKFGRFRVDVL